MPRKTPGGGLCNLFRKWLTPCSFNGRINKTTYNQSMEVHHGTADFHFGIGVAGDENYLE